MADAKPRRRQAQAHHPLLGDAATLRLMNSAAIGPEVAAKQPGLLTILGWRGAQEAIPQVCGVDACSDG